MNRNGYNNVKFFVGGEVEHTPAFSKRTLFVVGKQPIATIKRYAKEHKTPHIFMGANHSFDTGAADVYWNNSITALLDLGYMVTLDYPSQQHQQVLNMLNAGVWQSRNFVPLLNVQIPKVETSNPNLTVKIDDVDFNSTNPGVWCLHFHEITDSNRFTDWVEYAADVVIGDITTPERVELTVSLQEPVEDEVDLVKNKTEVGLDSSAASLLKPEPITIQIPEITTKDAADAYAAGAKKDPIGKQKGKK